MTAYVYLCLAAEVGETGDSSAESRVIGVVVNWKVRSLKAVGSSMNNEDAMSKLYRVPLRHAMDKWFVDVWTAAV